MSEIEWVFAAIVTITSAARITRLITADSFPPSMWVRMKWHQITKDNHWSLLVDCPYCFAVWSSGFVLLWGYLAEFHWTWWLFNGWLGAAYLAAIMVIFDGDD